MSSVQPRFEWRAWSDRLDDVAGRLRDGSECLERRSTTETYIVAHTPGTNPKVRFDRLDIKVLRAVEAGFQQWDVALKTPFPVGAGTLTGEVFPLLGVSPIPLERPAYHLEALFREVVRPHHELVDVVVEKHREFYAVEGCTAEFAEVTIAGRAVQTAAIESIDLECLHEAREATGLVRYENVSYPEMIRRTIGWVAV